jgi:hypothetical protein
MLRYRMGAMCTTEITGSETIIIMRIQTCKVIHVSSFFFAGFELRGLCKVSTIKLLASHDTQGFENLKVHTKEYCP